MRVSDRRALAPARSPDMAPASFVASYQTIADGVIHQGSGSRQALGRKVRIILQDIAHPFSLCSTSVGVLQRPMCLSGESLAVVSS
jgi:hypothetical protein